MFELSDQNDSWPRTNRWPTYQPMVLVTVALAAGILLDRTFDLSWRLAYAGAWLCLITWGMTWFQFRTGTRKPKLELLGTTALLVGMVCVGSFWHHGRWNWFGVNEIGRYARNVAAPCCIEASVVSEPRWRVARPAFGDSENTIRTQFSVRLKKIRDGVNWKPASGTIDLVIHDKVEHVRAGDRVRVFGRLIASSPPSNPGQFDFQNFYRTKSKLAFVHAQQADAVQVIEPASWSASIFLSTLRRRLNEITWDYIAPEEAAFASAILLGNREQLSKTRRDAFLETGTVHLLAISGLHLGILAGSFFLLFRLGVASRTTCLWATILFVVFYAWLVEFRPPVSRAAILVSLFCWGRISGESGFSFNLLAIAGLIVLILNPSDLVGAGPQLSFLAVTTLMLGKDWVFWAPSKDPIKRLIANSRPPAVAAMYWLGQRLRTAVLACGFIWFVAVPLVAHRFHLVAPIALVINPLLMLPIAWGLYSGLGVLVFGWSFPPLATVCGWFCDKNLRLIEWLIGIAQSVPNGHFWTAGPPAWSVAIFYAGVFLFGVFPPSRLPGRRLAALCAIWFVLGWLVPDRLSNLASTEKTPPLVCTFVDVGHGTSVIIQLPDQRCLLYDAGSFGAAEYGARNIAGVLWHQRIGHIDGVIISHADVDHFNALPILLEQFSLGAVYVTPQMAAIDSRAVTELFDTIKQHKIPVRELAKGDLLDFGAVDATILSPTADQVGVNDNADSLVLALEYLGKSVLLPGDIERDGLQRLLDTAPRDFDLVMAAHHGSEHSNPPVFMSWATPEYVVISGGSQRISDKTASRFASPQRTVVRTDCDGAIRFVIEEKKMELKTWATSPW